MITKFTIQRDEWLNYSTYYEFMPKEIMENRSYHAHLLNENTQYNKCCLGFFCLELGFTQEDILNQEAPVSIFKEDSSKVYLLEDLIFKTNNTYGLKYDNATSGLLSEAMKINDKPGYTKEEREELLIELFEEEDIILTFEGEYK